MAHALQRSSFTDSLIALSLDLKHQHHKLQRSRKSTVTYPYKKVTRYVFNMDLTLTSSTMIILIALSNDVILTDRPARCCGAPFTILASTATYPQEPHQQPLHRPNEIITPYKAKIFQKPPTIAHFLPQPVRCSDIWPINHMSSNSQCNELRTSRNAA